MKVTVHKNKTVDRNSSTVSSVAYEQGITC